MLRRIGLLVFLGALGLVIAPRSAEADCRTTSVCVFQGGRQVCRTEQQCVARRVPICTYRDSCTPTKSCTTAYGRTVCSYRDVCRRIQVCS